MEQRFSVISSQSGQPSPFFSLSNDLHLEMEISSRVRTRNQWSFVYLSLFSLSLSFFFLQSSHTSLFFCQDKHPFFKWDSVWDVHIYLMDHHWTALGQVEVRGLEATRQKCPSLCLSNIPRHDNMESMTQNVAWEPLVFSLLAIFIMWTTFC